MSEKISILEKNSYRYSYTISEYQIAGVDQRKTSAPGE
jgi:hypothetical protein